MDLPPSNESSAHETRAFGPRQRPPAALSGSSSKAPGFAGGYLLVNAIKYGAADAPVRVLVTGREDDLLFEVWNSGPAIDQSTLGEMFDPLKRGLTSTQKRDDRGSLGLGLYIAREIAKAHGGDISARSEEKETVFRVCLPRRPMRS